MTDDARQTSGDHHPDAGKVVSVRTHKRHVKEVQRAFEQLQKYHNQQHKRRALACPARERARKVGLYRDSVEGGAAVAKHLKWWVENES